MRVIFMGTPDFSVGTLQALIDAGHEVVLAVTQPDKPKGRGKSMQFPPVKEAALEHGIEVYQPRRVREPECVEYLRSFDADIIVVVAFGQILPKEILEMPKYGCDTGHFLTVDNCPLNRRSTTVFRQQGSVHVHTSIFWHV